MTEAEQLRRLRDNLARVRENVAAAAARSGRPADAVQLVGVTKYVAAPLARRLAEAGLAELGEARPQELWAKAAALADLPVHWHLIGHLQRNKVKRTLPLWPLIHSADSLRLLEELSREATAAQTPVDVLLEVNISGDEAKHGFAADELAPLLSKIAGLTGVFVRGLMGMAALEGGPDRARRDFASLRELANHLAAHCPPTIKMGELSMGMSGDYEIAIEEGATIVRVGTALFEGILKESQWEGEAPTEP
ncbi:MAG: YggS family pyridoxal phosphate-dependent enzyme [Pirellulaceae bacterium]|nr:YggS family pyridoxal phosphate-dependent enzyme [Pirellulaceae bacterium]